MRKLLIAALVMASALAVVPFTGITASAGEKKTVFVEEKFEEDFLSKNKWINKADSGSMNANSSEDTAHIYWTDHVEQFQIGTAEKVVNLKTFQFDFLLNDSKWKAINFMSNNDLSVTVRPDVFDQDSDFYAAEIFLKENGLHTGGNSSVTLSQNGSVMTMDWYTFKMEVTSETTADVYLSLQGQMEGSTPISTMTLKSDADYTFNDLFIYLSCEAGSNFHLDNLYIDSDNIKVNDNFTDGELDSALKEYRAVNGMTYKAERANSYLEVKEALDGDSLIYKAAIPVDESIVGSIELLNVSFNACFNTAREDKLAFAWGMSDSMDYKDGAYLCVMDSEGLTVCKYENGEMVELLERISIMSLRSKAGEMIKIVANKDGGIVISVDGQVAGRVQVEDEGYYAGYFGFVAVQENFGAIMVDDLKILTAKYQIPVTKSVTHNFSGDYFGNEGFEDFVQNATGGTQYVKDGELVWDGLSDWSYFGSAHQYDNFVLDFKITGILVNGKDSNDMAGTPNGKWLGIDIGKQLKTEVQYGKNFTLMFPIARPVGTEQEDWNSVRASLWTNTGASPDASELSKNITLNKEIPASYFKDIQYGEAGRMESQILAKDALCVRLVAENGTLKLYMKKACELQFTLYFVAEDMDTMGYTALCCTGFTYMKFDDFSMSNISDLYICADSFLPEPIVKPGKDNIIYDRGHTDMNGLTEAELNGGNSMFNCSSYVSVSYCALPLVLAGTLLMKKRKDRDEK